VFAFVAATVVVVGPSPSASATTTSLEASVTSKINSDRHKRGLPSFKRNYYMDKAVEKLTSALAAGHEHDYPIAGTYVGVDSVSYNEPAVRQTSCRISGDSRPTGALQVLSIAGCLESTVYNSSWKDANYNYAAVAIVIKGSKTYAILLMASYDHAPAKTLYSSKPSISGHIGVGSTLTARRNSWSPTSGTTFSYEWYVDGEPAGSGTTYTPTVSELGKTIFLSVSGSKTGYWAPERVSSTYTIKPGILKKGKVTVAGNRNVGQTLTAMPGTWAPVDTAFTYQWLRSGKTIVGETDDTYELTVADYGKKIDVKVTGSATAYSTASVTTHTSTTTKHPLLDVASTPVIVGDPTYKQVLTVDVGDWQPAPVTLTYQWRINGKAVYKATKPTFTVPSSAVGKAITVTVKGSHAGYSSVYRTSEPTELVASIPFAVEGVVTVTGTHAVGKKLTAHRGTWSPSASYSYRWYRDGVSLSGATASTYTVTSKSAGHTLTVKVTAKRAGYTTTTSTSDEIAIP
jgi:hypothetical protein